MRENFLDRELARLMCRPGQFTTASKQRWNMRCTPSPPLHVSLAGVGKSTTRIHRCLPHAGCHRRSNASDYLALCTRLHQIYEQDR